MIDAIAAVKFRRGALPHSPTMRRELDRIAMTAAQLAAVERAGDPPPRSGTTPPPSCSSSRYGP